MKNLQKISFYTVIIIAVSLVFYFSYNYYKKLKQPITPVVNSVPSDAILFAKFNNVYNVWNVHNKFNEIWNGMKQITYFKNTDEDLTFINTIVGLNATIKQILQTQNAVLSLNFCDSNKLGMLFNINLPLAFNNNEISNLLNEANIKIISKENYNSTDIYCIKVQNKEYYFTTYKGVFAGSSYNALVKKSVLQIDNNKSKVNDFFFSTLDATAGKKVDANLYYNFNQISKLYNNLFNRNIPFPNYLQNFAKWVEMDLVIKRKQLLFSGFVSSADSYLDIFRDEKAQKVNVTDILPSNTIILLNFNFSSFVNYIEKYRQYIQKNNRFISYQNELNNLNLSVKFNITDNFKNWMGNSFSLALLHTDGIQQDNVFVICHTLQNQKADSCLKAIARASQYNLGIPYEENKIHLNNLFQALFGKYFPSTQELWFEVTQNFVIFGSDKESLQNYQYALKNNDILSNTKNYTDFITHLPVESNIFFYANLDFAGNFIKNCVNHNLLKEFNTNFPVIQGFHKAAFQISQREQKLYASLYLSYDKPQKKITESITYTPEIITEPGNSIQVTQKPIFFKNSKTGNKQFLMYDKSAGILFVIDMNSNIIWKTKIQGKILGNCFEINNKKRGKLFLFNTGEAFYLIDEYGKTIENFPIKFKKTATTGLCLTQYKNIYRIYIPDDYHYLNCYNLDGEKINEFNAGPSKEIQTKEAQHIIFNNKDLLIVTDKNGNFSILDRKGKIYINPKTNFLKNINSGFYNDGKYLLTKDNSNNIQYISNKGEVFTKKFNGISNNSVFYYEDFNGDGTKDFLFVNEKELIVCNKNAKVLFRYKFQFEVFPEINIDKLSNNQILMTFLGKNQQLYIFNKKGLIDNSLQIKSNTLPVIQYDTKNKTVFVYSVLGNKIQLNSIK